MLATIEHLQHLKTTVDQATDLSAVKAAVSGLFEHVISGLVAENEALCAGFPGLREAQEKHAKALYSQPTDNSLREGAGLGKSIGVIGCVLVE